MASAQIITNDTQISISDERGSVATIAGPTRISLIYHGIETSATITLTRLEAALILHELTTILDPQERINFFP